MDVPAAASSLTAGARGLLARKRVQQLQQQKQAELEAIVLVQANARGTVVRSQAKQQQESAAKLQAVRRGRLARSEVAQRRLHAQEQASAGLVEAFHRMDFNNDGVLSRIEVIKACRNDEAIRSLLGLPR